MMVILAWVVWKMDLFGVGMVWPIRATLVTTTGRLSYHTAGRFFRWSGVQCHGALGPTFALGHRWLAYNLPPHETVPWSEAMSEAMREVMAGRCLHNHGCRMSPQHAGYTGGSPCRDLRVQTLRHQKLTLIEVSSSSGAVAHAPGVRRQLPTALKDGLQYLGQAS